MEIKDLFREVKYPIQLFNEQGEQIYYENSEGKWCKREFNDEGKEAYFENSSGDWYKIKRIIV